MDSDTHRAWLDEEGRRLTSFAAAAADPGGGFGWLTADGGLDRDRPTQTWITARMTHVFSLAHLRGEPGAGALADHGLAALRGPLRDHEHGGWFSSADPAATEKAGYEHAFVVLAAASATAAARPGAADLLAEALDVVGTRFWEPREGRCLESWDRTWTEPEPYRGANSNMHMVEAFIAAGDVTGDPAWRQRALSIAERVIHQAAAGNNWRLVEHFDTSWRPLLDYNADAPDHPFRPYGTTVGHWLEWSRLLLHLEAGAADAPAWLLADATTLFDLAVRHGWRADGADGFVYTLDWSDRPVVRPRMHWVVAEAILTAAALHRRTGEARFEEWYRTWWDYAARHLLDRRSGSWHHELDPENRPSASVWSGKPDVYHAYQAVLLPQLPPAPAAAAALRDAG
ncbi:N-acyl-D-glucosamine 2-epimerase [Marinitenerispora sediminis]|uniref:N-acyl-D-glucosamine 2-epimerase n=1 Tax=Marinitenerispora sediminis TaxID=1931232 RepID=A0A368T0T5_9ACTN|nr:N-acyl-D-glucosamine 2-epimerase [Marinitenerispora sediminis]RCV50036.1 N-acyl-D-glucosamine 2-epimerase [Marinitenerispora sediminis]RCV53284.1 N-acyl-D-glucosamine 2-epimerase [Marinitenerispora sediminis]